MTVWEALEFLDTLVDDSDPDVDFTESNTRCRRPKPSGRRMGRAPGSNRRRPRSRISERFCVCLASRSGRSSAIHSRSAVAASPKIVHSHFFCDNPDAHVAEYQTECGMYNPAAGSTTFTSWGHDKYITRW